MNGARLLAWGVGFSLAFLLPSERFNSLMYTLYQAQDGYLQ